MLGEGFPLSGPSMLKQRPSVARLKFMAEEDAKLFFDVFHDMVFQWIPVKFQKMATFRPGVVITWFVEDSNWSFLSNIILGLNSVGERNSL